MIVPRTESGDCLGYSVISILYISAKKGFGIYMIGILGR